MGAHVEHLVHTHILLGCEQKRTLRRLAATRDTSLSALLRDAIDHYFRVVSGPTPDHLRQIARAAAGSLDQPGEIDAEGRDTGWGEAET
jgi:hypothetical protein